MTRWPRSVAVAVTIVATALVAAGAASFAIDRLQYGWGLFVGVPFFVGLFAATMLRLWGRRSLGHCFIVAAIVGVVLSLGFLVMGKEGVICILLSVPLAMPLVLFGALIGYLLVHRTTLVSPGGTAALLVLGLGAAMWGETTVTRTAPVFVVTDAINVAAPPDVVWQSLVSLSTLPPPDDWIFRVGLACPQRTEIRGAGVGATRVCTLSTGELEEQITVWQPGRRLEWTVVSTPPPLEEVNPFRETHPPHLHGFYRSLTGGFELRPTADGGTRMVRRSSYQHHLYPAAYWRLWCDVAASRGHRYVLRVIKARSEAATPMACRS